jgi:PPOX class probable F420-dependent enzyme
MARDRGVAMEVDAVAALLDEQRTLTLATIGPDGMPHLAAMWFLREGSGDDMTVLMWTYGTSQKARNLARDPRASLMAEGGDTYDQLRGVCLDCHVELIDTYDEVLEIGQSLHRKYLAGPGAGPDLDAEAEQAVLAGLKAQAKKRVGMRFHVDRARSWDHRKLGAR